MPRKTTEAAATTKTKKSVVRASLKKTAAKKTPEPAVLTWEHVAERAYYLHLETGQADPTENWLRAERELALA
jgi:hypothetical protein